MKRITLIHLFAACSLGLLFTLPAQVQAQEENNGPIFDLTQPERAAGSNLDRWLGVSVSLTLKQLKENAVAEAALTSYVQKGGVVFLHTDAASLFDYVTVPAAQVLQGPVAVAQGVPLFGAHPLLSVSGDCDFTARIPGIHEIAFTPGEDDVLVVGHPVATPLMWIEGVQTPDGKPVYALAIAPKGRGWAIFSPYRIEDMAEGLLLIDNLRKFARSGEQRYVPLSLRSILAATDQGDLGPLKAELQGGAPQQTALPFTATEPAELGKVKMDADQNPQVAFPMMLQDRDDQTSLPLAPGETEALLQALETGGRHANGFLGLLRARAEYSRGNIDQAQKWLTYAGREAPEQQNIKVWEAILSIHATENEDFVLDPKIRASRLDKAARIWQKAVDDKGAQAGAALPAENATEKADSTKEVPIKATAAINLSAANPAGTDEPVIVRPAPIAKLVTPEKERFVGGVSCDVLAKWSQGAIRAVPFGPLTPPGAIEIRGMRSRFMLRSAAKSDAMMLLGQAVKAIADENEVPITTTVLFFPDDLSYRRYATQAGLQNGPSKELLMNWYYTRHLGIMPAMNREDEQRFRNDLVARLKAPDMNRNRIFLNFLAEIHAHTLVRSISGVQIASDFFGPTLFEKVRLAFFQNI